MLFIKLLTCQCQWCTWHWDLPKMNYIFNSKTLMWDYSEIIQNQFISVGLLFQWLPCLQFCKINWYCCWSVLMLSSDVCNRREIYMFRLESISGAGWSPEWVWNVKCDLLLPTEHSGLLSDLRLTSRRLGGENRPPDGMWLSESKLQMRGQQGNYLNVNVIGIMKSIIVNNTQMSISERT